MGAASVAGLKTDGTVIVTGPEKFNTSGEVDTDDWTDIVQGKDTLWCTYALNSKGELLYSGRMPEEDQTIFDQYQWKNLRQIESDGWYLLP